MADVANTVIQIKYSEANSRPTSLAQGELAYSFVSNTLFIGTDADANYEIGGKHYIERSNSAYLHANSAYISQNTTGFYANSAYTLANSIFISLATINGGYF